VYKYGWVGLIRWSFRGLDVKKGRRERRPSRSCLLSGGGLEPELAVRGLAPTLALLAAAVAFEFQGGCGAELVDVAA
jgi:hypothetical protein